MIATYIPVLKYLTKVDPVDMSEVPVFMYRTWTNSPRNGTCLSLGCNITYDNYMSKNTPNKNLISYTIISLRTSISSSNWLPIWGKVDIPPDHSPFAAHLLSTHEGLQRPWTLQASSRISEQKSKHLRWIFNVWGFMGFNGNTMGISCHIIYLVGGFSPTPLKNDGVRQLG